MTPIPVASVMFLTGPDDPLPPLFAEECASHNLLFFTNEAHAQWAIAWVCDGDGQVQPWLEYIAGGPENSWFLGSDPGQAMRRAVGIIRAWELPGTGKPN